MALSVPYPAAANPYLAVPTPAVSPETTPVFETLLVTDRYEPPYPNIALSVPYPVAAKVSLAVPTPAVSVATTPVLETKFVNEYEVANETEYPYPNIAF